MATPLDTARYINLESFKKDGNGVKTPVWAAPLDGRLVVFTEGKSFKVKRIRNNPRIRAAQCGVSGDIRGPFYEGTARIIDDDPTLERRAYDALRAKYGLQMRVLDFFSGLAGKKAQRKIIEISLT
jgi:PPOX class probable F420-dependent enzyme